MGRAPARAAVLPDFDCDYDVKMAFDIGDYGYASFDFVLMSVDTAFTEKHENDPTASSNFGVEQPPEDADALRADDLGREKVSFDASHGLERLRHS
jgi:hypothetical protein